MNNKTNKLEKIKIKIEQLQARAASLEAHERTKEKKLDTRRKILVGAYFIEKFKGKENQLIKELDSFLVRDNDRKLFGLPPKNGVNDEGKQEKN
jgi:NCAIR mutase (PurE)-related protein